MANGKVVKVYLIGALLVAFVISIFFVHVAIQHNPQEEFCTYTAYPECDYKLRAIAGQLFGGFLLSLFFLLIPLPVYFIVSSLISWIRGRKN